MKLTAENPEVGEECCRPKGFHQNIRRTQEKPVPCANPKTQITSKKIKEKKREETERKEIKSTVEEESLTTFFDGEVVGLTGPSQFAATAARP